MPTPPLPLHLGGRSRAESSRYYYSNASKKSSNLRNIILGVIGIVVLGAVIFGVVHFWHSLSLDLHSQLNMPEGKRLPDSVNVYQNGHIEGLHVSLRTPISVRFKSWDAFTATVRSSLGHPTAGNISIFTYEGSQLTNLRAIDEYLWQGGTNRLYTLFSDELYQYPPARESHELRWLSHVPADYEFQMIQLRSVYNYPAVFRVENFLSPREIDHLYSALRDGHSSDARMQHLNMEEDSILFEIQVRLSQLLRLPPALLYQEEVDFTRVDGTHEFRMSMFEEPTSKVRVHSGAPFLSIVLFLRFGGGSEIVFPNLPQQLEFKPLCSSGLFTVLKSGDLLLIYHTKNSATSDSPSHMHPLELAEFGVCPPRGPGSIMWIGHQVIYSSVDSRIADRARRWENRVLSYADSDDEELMDEDTGEDEVYPEDFEFRDRDADGNPDGSVFVDGG